MEDSKMSKQKTSLQLITVDDESTINASASTKNQNVSNSKNSSCDQQIFKQLEHFPNKKKSDPELNKNPLSMKNQDRNTNSSETFFQKNLQKTEISL